MSKKKMEKKKVRKEQPGDKKKPVTEMTSKVICGSERKGKEDG